MIVVLSWYFLIDDRMTVSSIKKFNVSSPSINCYSIWTFYLPVNDFPFYYGVAFGGAILFLLFIVVVIAVSGRCLCVGRFRWLSSFCLQVIKKKFFLKEYFAQSGNFDRYVYRSYREMAGWICYVFRSSGYWSPGITNRLSQYLWFPHHITEVPCPIPVDTPIIPGNKMEPSNDHIYCLIPDVFELACVRRLPPPLPDLPVEGNFGNSARKQGSTKYPETSTNGYLNLRANESIPGTGVNVVDATNNGDPCRNMPHSSSHSGGGSSKSEWEPKRKRSGMKRSKKHGKSSATAGTCSSSRDKGYISNREDDRSVHNYRMYLTVPSTDDLQDENNPHSN